MLLPPSKRGADHCREMVYLKGDWDLKRTKNIWVSKGILAGSSQRSSRIEKVATLYFRHADIRSFSSCLRSRKISPFVYSSPPAQEVKNPLRTVPQMRLAAAARGPEGPATGPALRSHGDIRSQSRDRDARSWYNNSNNSI